MGGQTDIVTLLLTSCRPGQGRSRQICSVIGNVTLGEGRGGSLQLSHGDTCPTLFASLHSALNKQTGSIDCHLGLEFLPDGHKRERRERLPGVLRQEQDGRGEELGAEEECHVCTVH